MTTAKKIWLGILVLVVVIIGGGYLYLRSTLPEYNGTVKLAGITGEVEIIRDTYGMPHIYAENDPDAFYALGYCMAQDRLFHMDMVRRAATGRLSEILGESMVEVDRLFRTLTAGTPVAAIADQYPPHIKEAGQAFAAGFNAYLQNREGPLPIEFTILGYEPEPWKFSDGVAVHYYMAWDLNGAFANELRHAAVLDEVGREMAAEIFPAYPQGYPTIVPSAETTLKLLETLELARQVMKSEGGGASNSWVISGAKTESGMPLLANDPHLGHGMPGIWYEAHLVTPELNVSGAILPGIPYVVIGANEHVAWGFTNVMADDADFYVERLNPENPDQYAWQGGWEDMAIREEVIQVSGGEDVRIRLRLTRHGPVIDDVNNYEEPADTALTMRWTAYEKLQGLIAFEKLNRAESVDDIEAAVEYFKCPGQNWVYADDKGHIGYWAAVGIPIRDGFDGALPVDGWSGRYEWQGYVSTGEQPHLRDPKRGWIATANNRHVGDDYPYPISHYYAMPDRYVRIREMLTAKEKLDVGDFERMHSDFDMVLAREWVPLLLNMVDTGNLIQRETEALQMLREWDYTARAEGVAPTIFHVFINALVENTFRQRLGDRLYGQYIRSNYMVLNALRDMVNRGGSAWFDDPETGELETMSDVWNRSFKQAVAFLAAEMGAGVDDWIWGELHTLTFEHPFGSASDLMGRFLNRGPYPIGGSFATVNPQAYRFQNPWGVNAGASLRYIIDFGDRSRSRRVIPAGISGNFMSPHYDDQVKLWLSGRYRPFVLDRPSIEADRRYRLVLLPE